MSPHSRHHCQNYKLLEEYFPFQFCIIITSDYQSSNSSGGSIIEAAQRVKAKGVSVNIVAVGSGEPSQDIYQTASSIDHVYHAKSTSSVSEQLNKIARNECQGERKCTLILTRGVFLVFLIN